MTSAAIQQPLLSNCNEQAISASVMNKTTDGLLRDTAVEKTMNLVVNVIMEAEDTVKTQQTEKTLNVLWRTAV
jgi:hypothetical protein